MNDENIRLDGVLYREVDGYTPEDVRMIAAKKNIAEGSGTSIDTAKILRELGGAENYPASLPRRGAMYEYGIALSRLGDEAFEKVINGYVRPEQGAVIANIIRTDHAKQSVAIDIVAQEGIDTLSETELMARQILSTPTETVEQTNLFGTQQILQSSAVEKIKIIDGAIKQLKKSKNLMAHLGNNSKAIEKNGNKLNKKNNEELKKSAGTAIEIIKKQAFYKGAISDKAGELAQKYKNGDMTYNQAVMDFCDFCMQENILDIVFGNIERIEQKNNEAEIYYQSANTAGAKNNEIEQAQKEWNEKGVLSRFFKKWFGKSKVVDENGKPLVVYHGTENGSFEVFSDQKVEDGFFFTDNLDTAKEFAEVAPFLAEDMTDEEMAEASKIYEVYLKIENPYIADMGGEEYRGTAVQGYIDEAKELGHDGVIIKNIVDKRYNDNEGSLGTDYIVFNPEQIKSVNNQGTFNSSHPNIYYQSAYHGTPHRFDNFSTEHIGTGEGAQAHGWGLYFAENKDVSEGYRKRLLPDDADAFMVKGKKVTERDELYGIYNMIGGCGQKQIIEWLDRFDALLIGKPFKGDSWKKLDDEMSLYDLRKIAPYRNIIETTNEDDIDIVNNYGQLFEVDIPEDDVLLDEDKLLGNQILQKGLVDNLLNWANDNGLYYQVNLSNTGEEIYDAISRKLGSDKAASELLNELGFKGITYDGHRDGRCYVIFDDKAVDVLKTYYQSAGNMSNKIDNVVDLTNEFDKVPTFEEIEKHIKDIIASGEVFDTLSPEWKIDIKGGNRVVDKITNEGNFQKLNMSAKKRHNKYVKAVKNLINNAKYSHPDKNTKPKEKPDVLNYHYFDVAVKIGDKTYNVRLECEETKNAPKGGYAKRSKNPSRSNNNVNQNNNDVNSKVVHLYNIKEIKKPEMYYQGDNADTNNETGITEPLDLADTNEDYEKLIAGFTQQEVLNKIVSILEEIENTPDEKTKLKLMKKNNILEDVLSASENQIKFHDAREREDLYLNAYYIMKNQEIPENYIDTTAKSQQAYSDLKKLHDKKKEKAQEEYLGYFTEGKEKTLITIMSNHDKSTILHECGHLFLNGLNELASVSPKIKADLEKVNKWLGADGTGEYTVKQQEKFARSYEAYLYKGKAPNSALKRAFEKFKEWLKSAYLNINNLADKGADISDEAHELFTEMFAGDSYVEDRKAADELLKTIKTKAKKARKNNPLDRELDEVEKRHKNVSYEILSAATGKSVKYLKTIFETDSEKHGLGKKRENVQELLDDVDDKITVSGGLRKEWSEFYSDTGVNYETEDLGGDYKLVMQAYETILNKSYRNPAKDILSEAEERALYFEKAVDNADREYRLILREYKNGNRNAALAAFYDWCDALDEEIREDYEDRFIYDTGMIERNENTAVYDKAKRKIMQKARELDNQLSINKNEKYKELVKETVKDLSFLNPYDKARLTANILDVPSTEFLISSLNNIMDIAQTMEDVRYRRELERKIHVELKGTKNYKKNGRTVGKYDYRSNKIFEALRSYEKLSQDAANDLLLKESHFAEGEDNGLTYKNKLINMYLSYKAGGRTYTDTEMMKKIYDEIIRIKLIGKSAKSELELIEKLEGDKDVDELIDIVEAQPKKINILKKAYINGIANLESTINAVFGKDIMTKYATEILYAETQAQAWQYQQKKKFTDAVAEIYNLPKWNWDFQILKYLSEKHVYQEIRRKYDKDEIVKTRLIDREMTHMDIICAYIWSKNAVLEKRLINQFGEETLNQMFDELSLEDVKLAELMMNTAQSFYPAVNRAFINKYGLDLPKVSCYFPSTPERGSEVDLYNEYSAKSLNNSFTKARAATENLPMDFHNPVEILFNHIEGVAKFTFMSDSLDKANLRFRNADLKRAIINKYGKAVYQTLEQELINITYKKEAPVFSGMGKVFDNMIGNWITGNIAIKPVVGLKQLLSATNYSVDMPVTDWTAGFVKSLADFKNTIDYMMKIPYINARFHGNYSNEFLKQTIENSAFAASQKLKDACTLFVKIGDIGAIIFGGKPYIDYLITKKGMTEEEAIKQFIISTNRSQQSSLVSSLSNFQVAMTRNPFGKLFIAFKNAPQQYIRMCGDAIISCKNGDMSKTRLAKTLFQFGYLQPFLYTLATSGALLRFLFTGDPDDVIKDFKMSFFDLNSSAIPFFGEVYKYTVNRLSDDGKYIPQSTPLLGDIEREINRLSKEDITLKDIAESLSYMTLHIGLGYNGKAIINTGSGIGDIFTGSPVQGAMKLFGYTDKRAKRIAGNE